MTAPIIVKGALSPGYAWRDGVLVRTRPLDPPRLEDYLRPDGSHDWARWTEDETAYYLARAA